jgi:hypothetical protein
MDQVLLDVEEHYAPFATGWSPRNGARRGSLARRGR